MFNINEKYLDRHYIFVCAYLSIFSYDPNQQNNVIINMYMYPDLDAFFSCLLSKYPTTVEL